MIGVVLDTNIVVSANLNEEGAEAAVVALAVTSNLRLYVTESILAEYEDVLRREKFKFDPERVTRFLALIRHASTLLTDVPSVHASPHEADNEFLACAEAAQADFLITGNTRHFPNQWQTTRIVTTREFIDCIDLETDEPA
jgi:uncharacterized protein